MNGQVTEPHFLSLRNVLLLHAGSIAIEGGFPGVRDPKLLETAVMTPQRQFDAAEAKPDLESIGAAYLYHLAASHPFLDGNERVAAMAAFVFLDVNGIELTAAPKSLETLVLAVASGTTSKEGVTEWVKRHSSPRDGQRPDPGA